MKQNKELETLIKRTIDDTQYVLDDAKPIQGIFRTLRTWFMFYLISSLLLIIGDTFLLPHLFELNSNLNTMSLYFSFKRIMTIVLFIIPAITYWFTLLKHSMSVKEKDFLKSSSPFIMFFSLSRMIYPIAYYLNPTILLTFNNTLPLDLVVNLFLVLLLFNYSRSNMILATFVFNCIYLILNFISQVMLLDNVLHFSNLNANGIVLMTSFVLILMSLNDSRGDKHE